MGNCLTGSEAIFGFCAWLTTRKEKAIMSRVHDAAPICEIIKIFCDENKLPEPRENYTDYLTIPKDGRFEVGDPVECVDASDLFGSDFLKEGEKYTISKLTTSRTGDYLHLEDNNGSECGGFSHRFKLIEPDTPEDFTYEYFHALNEQEAEKYKDMMMEFADSPQVRKNIWVKDKLIGIGYNATSFETFDSYWQFCRTCPETFQKKKVKKTFERWVNIYLNDSLGMGIHKTRECADYHARRNRIDCIHIYKEYEVEE